MSDADEVGGTGRVFCAEVARASGEDPIGYAVPFEMFLLVEVATPWAYNLLDSAGVPPSLRAAHSAARAGGRRVRLLGVVPDREYQVPGHSRVVAYRRPAGPFAQFQRTELLVPDGQRFAATEALLRAPDDLEAWAAYSRGEEVRDMLVCTHGTHDACCALFGYPLYWALRKGHGGGGPVRVWRASHFGGHRFAPTLIDLPAGHYWAFLTPETLDPLVLRSGDPAALRGHYRGWCGAETLFEQVAERECWLREGWPWLGYRRATTLLDAEGGLAGAAERAEDEAVAPRWAMVRVAYTTPAGREGAYLVRVELRGSVGWGGCGDGEGTMAQYGAAQVEHLG